MIKILTSTVAFAACSLGLSTFVNAAQCGSVTIASMNWQSAEVLSAIDSKILEAGYGCSVEIIVGDTVPTLTSMATKGQPDIAPEFWIDMLPTLLQQGVSEKRVVIAGTSLPDGGLEGWWIPKYFADAHPDIRTVRDALKHPELFPAPDDPSKGAVYNSPQGWGSTTTTAQLFKALNGTSAGFELVDTGSAAGLDGSIAKAYERRQPWLGYYWAPTSLLGKYEMVRLDVGTPHDDAEWKRCNTVLDCPDPKVNDWPVGRIRTIVAASFVGRADPAVMNYLENRSWHNNTAEELMAWMTANQASGADAARHFLKTNEDVWAKWVSSDVVERIKAAE